MPKVTTPTNNLATRHPELVKEWHPTKNDRGPEQYAPQSGKKAWWVCPKGHEWEVTISCRSQGGTGCPYCSGRRCTKDRNFAAQAPHLVSEWSPKNEKGPETYSPQSHHKAWWVCPSGHDWQARIQGRFLGTAKCPRCLPRSVATESPSLVAEWHPRNDVGPEEYAPKSNKRVWWLCSEGHAWKTQVCTRTSGSGCPVCARAPLVPDLPLVEVSPVLAAEWHPRNDRPPSDFSPCSHKKVWWKCSEKGHEWEATIKNRFLNGTGCPKCSLKGTSKAEQEVYAALEGMTPEHVSHRDRSLGFEVDIYVPSRKLAIEYCGLYWHSTATRRDRRHIRDKHNACEALGVRLITIFEDEWLTRPEVVNSRLEAILGCSQRIGARTLDLRPVPPKDARDFCRQHHLQGPGQAKAAYGLYRAEDLVSVMTFSKGSKAKGGHDDWEINRFCSLPGIAVSGGASRLFKAFLREHDPERVISYCDLRWGTGKVYESLGMTLQERTPANYWYTDGRTKRTHRFAYRKQELLRRFGGDPASTEEKLAGEQGLFRLYDAGSLKFLYVRSG